ncbi:MAG: hypothetical protein WDO15_06520 [Bacteroidota bacterium]
MKLVFTGHSSSGKPSKIQVALIDKDGRSFGSTFTLNDVSKPICSEHKRPGPGKNCYSSETLSDVSSLLFRKQGNAVINLDEIESVQFSIGPGLSESEAKEPQTIAIESVRLE